MTDIVHLPASTSIDAVCAVITGSTLWTQQPSSCYPYYVVFYHSRNGV